MKIIELLEYYNIYQNLGSLFHPFMSGLPHISQDNSIIFIKLYCINSLFLLKRKIRSKL